MIKVISTAKTTYYTILMREMKPLQIGRIRDNRSSGNNHLVMRTSSNDKFEVIDLDESKIDSCWTSKSCDLEIELLSPGETVTIQISNDKV